MRKHKEYSQINNNHNIYERKHSGKLPFFPLFVPVIDNNISK